MSLLTESENPKTKEKPVLPGSPADTVGRPGGKPEEKDDAEIVIRIENVSVVYRAPSEHIKSLKEYAIRLLKRQVTHQEFRALTDINLELRRGEVFGLIGHNGAGKSTMLKVVSRVMKPTHGRVWVKGRIAPLLELGAGFHPELSGRENVFLNGTLLGYSRVEMKGLFDSIVEFAELEDFIDAPLRTYSTGMTVRLGFAVATATRPDILIVDEVLAVGDEQFQEKCADRIADFRRQGTTILLVTHSSATVKNMCNRAALLDHGRLCVVGLPGDVIDEYHIQQHKKNSSAVAEADEVKGNSEQHSSAQSDQCEASPEVLTMEAEALKRDWFYEFELSGGSVTNSDLPEPARRLHTDRLAMVNSALGEAFGTNFSTLSCLDIGCNQGYFAIEMARRGFGKVRGFDPRHQNIEDAILMRRIYGLDNLGFQVADINSVSANEIGQFDVVLMMGVLSWLENPIGALRKAKALTKKMLIIETPVASDLSGEVDWGNRQAPETSLGAFAVLDQAAECNSTFGSLTDLSLCPGRETLVQILGKLGFSSVEVMPVLPHAHEQLVSGGRIMIVAKV